MPARSGILRSAARHFLRSAAAALLGVVSAASVAGTPKLSAQSNQTPVLARTQILITSGGLVINPAHQVVPRNTATLIATAISTGNPEDPGEAPVGLPQDAVVLAELIGPAFGTAIQLATRPGEPFHIQPLPLAGLYYLRNIRLESGGAVLLTAIPDTVSLEVINELLVSQVTARALSAQEILDKGIVVDQTNFQVLKFTAAFGLQDHRVVLDLPMVLPRTNDGTAAFTAVPALSLPMLQPALTPSPSVDVPKLVDAFQTPNVSISGLLLKVEDEEIDRAFQIPPIPGVIVIPGNIAYLNQFFSVMLLVSNVAPGGSNLVVRDVRAEIVLPPGADTVAGSGDDPLRMARLGNPPAEQSKIQAVSQPGPDGAAGTADDVATIAPQESGQSEHLVEGLREGVHTVEMKITATLEGLPIGPVPVSGRVLGTVEVRNPTFALTLTHPATVSTGEEYDLKVTVTNTSSTPANFVSLNLLPRSVAGADLISSPSVPIESIAAGDAQTVTFRLRAKISGTVSATSFSSDGIPGRFELNTAVGALGIPMSPNTLVLPKATDSLPALLRDSALSFLGQAFALATSPVTPAGRLPITQQIVYGRSTELAQAGQRVGLEEPLSPVAIDLLLDWAGNNYARLATDPGSTEPGALARRQQDFGGFDDLLRASNRGQAVLDAIGSIFGDTIQTSGSRVFFDEWAAAAASRSPQLSALVIGAGAPSPIALALTDPQGRRVGTDDATGATLHGIPFAATVPIVTQGSPAGQLVVDASPVNGVYRFDGVATTSGTFDLDVVVPEAVGPRKLIFSDVTVQRGARISLPANIGGAPGTYDLQIDDDGNGTIDRSLHASINATVTAPALHVVSAVQVVTDESPSSKLGQLLAVLFNQAVDPATAQDGVTSAPITSFQIDGNQVVGVGVQPGGRVVLLSLRDGIGPLVARLLRVTDVRGVLGAELEPSTNTVPIVTSTLLSGGTIAGKVLRGDGTSVVSAQIRLAVRMGDQEVTVSVKNTDASGAFTFDYIPVLPVLLQAVDAQTGERGEIRSAITRNAQHLDLDVVLLGTGSLVGRAISPAGAPLAHAVIRVSSLTRFGEAYTAVTNDSGAFAITGIVVGNITIEAVHAATNARVVRASAIPRAGAVVNQDLILLPLAQVAQQTGSLSGQIYRADGSAPAAGVPVFTDRGGVTTTDGSGTYRLDGVPTGQVTIRAIDQPHFEQGTAVTTVVANAIVTANLRMSGGFGSIIGVVLDSDGTTVANAVVGGGSALVRTSATGEFALSDVPLGQRTVTALDEARQLTGSTSATISIPGEQVRVQVVLGARGSIAGRVFDSNGTTTVAGVKVYLLGGQNVSTTTDQNGGYRFDQVPVGAYQVSAFRSDFSDGNIVSTKVVFRGEVRIADVVFRGHGRVTGTVLAATTDTPLLVSVALTELQVRLGQLKPPENLECLDNVQVADITVEFPKCENVGIGFIAMPVNRITSTNVTTGRFSFDDVFVGPVTVQAGNALVGAMSAGGVISAPGQTLDLTMRATAPSAVGGTVYLPDGRAAGADVIVTYNGANVVTDLNGHYLQAHITPGSFQLIARDPASGLVAQAFGSVAPGMTADVPMHLLGLGRVNVLVIGSNGPIANAQIHLSSGAYPFTARDANANDQGRATFDGGDAVSEGPFSVSATDPLTGAVGSSGGVVPGANASVDVTITLSDEVGTVLGHLFGPDGTSFIKDAQIQLSSAGGASFTTTDSSGAFRFEGVRRGHVSLEAFDAKTARRGRAQGDIVTNHQEVPIDIVQVAQGTVRGVVRVSTDSSPVSGASVTISSQSLFGGQFQTSTDPDGTFTTPGVSAGGFTVTASDATRGLTGSASGTVTTEGEEVIADVILQVPPRGNVSGRVLAASGLPAFGAQVVINGSLRTTVDNDGFYSFANLPVGDVSVVALAAAGADAGAATGRLAFDGDAVTIVVHLLGTGSVSGVVHSAGGNAVQFARVTLSGRNILLRPVGGESQTDAEGRFRFDDVLLGEVTATAVQTGTGLAGSASGQIAAPGGTTDLVVTLQPAGLSFGRVVRADGTPASGMALELTGAAHRFGSTSADGAFTFTDLPLGTYTLAVTDPLGSGVIFASIVIASQGQSLDAGTLTLDEAPPAVLSIIPSNGATSVPVGQQIQVQFSEPIDVTTVNPSTLLVGSTAGATTGSWALSADGRTAAFTPAVRFADFAHATVKVTTGVHDRVGKPLTAEAVSSFTTADSTPPAVVSLAPAANAAEVQPEAVIRVTYSEAVDPARFSGTPIALLRNGAIVPGRVDFAFGNTVAIFTPLSPLSPNSGFDVVIAPASDIFGNRQAQTLTSHFQTIDTIAPAIQRLILPAADIFEGSVLNVTADVGTATDIALIEFVVNGQSVRTDSSAPYELVLPVNGALAPSFDLSARATDTAGNVGPPTHVAVTVRIDQSPAVSIVSPADGSMVQPGTSIAVRLHSTDDRGITRVALQTTGALAGLMVMDVSPAVLAHDDILTVDIPAGTAPGALTLRAVATDTASATSATASVTIQVVDTHAPSVTLISPTVDQRLGSGVSTTFEVDASDDVGVASITLTSSGSVASTTTRTISPSSRNAHGTFTIAIPDTATTVDQLAITVTARDASNNESAAVRATFTIRGPIGSIRGVVTSATGATLAGINISVTGPESAQTTTAADGVFSLDLVPGHYVLTASRPHAQGTAVTVSTPADVAVAAVATANITFPRTATIRGLVTRPDGSAAPGATVQLSVTGFSRSTAADATGHFVLADVPDGTFTLSASDLSSRSAAQVLVTVAGIDLTRDLALAPLFFHLSAARTGAGAGIVSSTPAGISCGNDCDEDFATATTIHLNAIPVPGSVFAGWSGDCAGLGECMAVADRTLHVVAQFDVAESAVCAAPAQGRIAFWPADDDAADAAGPHAGVLQNGVSFAAGYVGRAFSFDGVDDAIASGTPVLSAPRNTFTIEFWAQPTATRAQPAGLFGGIGGQRYAIAPEPRGADAGVGVSVGTNGIAVFEYGDNYLPAVLVYDGAISGWTHVAVVYEDKQPRLYVNGVLVATGTASSRPSVYPSKTFGNTPNNYGAYRGWLDEVAIYNRALADAEILAVFAAGSVGQCKGTTFDATADIAQRNPNGVWTYGATAVPGSITPFSVIDTLGGLTRWHAAPGLPDSFEAPNVLHNGTGAVYHDSFGDWPENQLALHPGNTEFSVIRFTAPASAQYTIQATFRGGDAATTDVHVARGTQLLFSGSITGQGDTQTFKGTASLARGETIDFLVGAGGNGFLDDTTFFSAAISTPNPTLTVTRSGTGTGSVTSSPAGIECGLDCVQLFPADGQVTVTAVPAAGSTFVGFGGACSGRDPDCVVVMTRGKQVTATFRADASGVDTDGDGLSDVEENARGTNPSQVDSDGDGFADAIEVAFGSDPLSVGTVPSFKRWTGADGAAPTSWFSASNWSPAGVPTISDNVLVPRNVAAYPTLTAPAATASLLVETGATIQIATFRLVASGNVFSFGAISGSEAVEVAGSGALVRGSLPSLVVTGGVTFAGATTINGNALVFGRFDIGGQSVRITQDLSIPCGPCTGQLRMTDPGGLLFVDRDAAIDGLDTSQVLTEGDLHIGRNFFVGGSATGNFAASTQHTTFFDGSAPQTITFCCGVGPSSRHFGQLVISNTSGVSLNSDAYVLGDLVATVGAVLTGPGTIGATNVTTSTNSVMTPGGVAVSGVLQSAGVFSPLTTIFTGANQLIPGALGYRNVTVTGSGRLAGAATMQGNVLLTGVFDLNGQALHITGSVSIPCAPCTGQLRMTDPAGVMTVDQDLGVDGLDTNGALTAGQLHIGRNLFVGGSTNGNFAASAQHTTFFDGSSAQTITFCCGVSQTTRHFGHVVVSNTSGVSLNSDAYALGSLTVSPGGVLTGVGIMAATDVIAGANSVVTPAGVALSGVLQSAGLFSPVTTIFSGANQLVPGALGYRNVTVTGSARLAAAAMMQGNVLLTGPFDLNGQILHISGSLTIPCSPCTGQLRMTDAAGVLTVDQDVVVDGLDTNGALTAGQLHVGRNFFVGGSANGNFAASPSHTTFFDGSSPQTITFCCGVGATSRHFGHAVFANAAGVSLNSDAFVVGDVTVRSGALLAGGGTVSLGGNMSTEAGTIVTPGGVALSGTLNAAGTFGPGTTTFLGQNQVIPGGLAYRNVTINGSAHMGGPATMTGTLLLTGPFDVAGQQVHVTGSLVIPCGPCTGQLRMTDVGGILTVDQDAVFDGLNTNGALTRGELRVGRNFFAGGSDNQNFAPSEQHTVVFDGNVQSIQFCCGVGVTSRHFANLRFSGGTTVTLLSDVLATGPLSTRPVGTSVPTILGAGHQLIATGADVTASTFDNVGVVVNQGALMNVQNATFRSYPPSATPLTINASVLSATFSGLEFQSAPGAQGAYIRGNDVDGAATLAELTIADSRPRNGLPKAVSTNGFVFHWGTSTDDTDGDGLTDADELQIYHTDPLLADTDGDGVSDGAEVTSGSDPVVAEICTAAPGGLLSWWPADNDATDVAGNRPGTVMSGVSFVPGRVGFAFHFDGTGFVEASAEGLPSGSAARTVEFWMRPQPNARAPFMYGAPSPSDGFYPLVNGNVGCIGQWGGGALQVCGTTDVADGNWHHLAMTYDGGDTVTLYVDGRVEASVLKSYNTTPGGFVRIGAPFQSTFDFFRGDVDDVAVYNRALRADEIQRLVVAGRAGMCVGVADARQDYSTAANPHGSWTYGASPTLGQIVPFTRVEGTAWLGAPGIAEYLGAPSTFITGGGSLGFHPGPNGDFGVIRWRASQAGTFQVDATFSAGDSTTTDVHVVANGVSIFDGTIIGFADTRAFHGVVTLNAGDTIDFAVGTGGNGFFSDSTLLDARITKRPGTP